MKTVTIKERPIIMSTESVRAIRAGLKTQTRRAVNGKWLPLVEEVLKINGKWVWTTLEYDLSTPYGVPGDRLWVKEEWRVRSWGEWPLGIEYKDGERREETGPSHAWKELDHIDWYDRMCEESSGECDKAGIGTDAEGIFVLGDGREWPMRWRRSMYMPRCCSRILLEVTDIRAERVQDIIYEECQAEGVAVSMRKLVPDPFGVGTRYFQELWDSINAKRGHPWENNDLVWVTGFKVLEGLA